MVAMVLYVAMATLADWNAFGQALSSIPAILWVKVTGLSLLSKSARYLRWPLFSSFLRLFPWFPVPFKVLQRDPPHFDVIA